MIKTLQLIGSILVCQLAGIIGSLFTVQTVNTWFKTLAKPAFNPPSYLFGPVWITLYTLMGIALFIVIQQGWQKHKVAILVFIIQLLLNTFWSFLFFGAQNPYFALINIVFLLIFIVLTTIKFWQANMWAGILFVPYIAWVSFATVLNFYIWKLNK